MLQKFQNHIDTNFSFLKDKKLLLATSGGLDSMVLVHLFQHANLNFALAHCNFQLRGTDSNEDENFVNNYASKNKISCFTIQFDTEKYSEESKLSTQLAARKLRYDWFNELLVSENFDFVATAHHLDDQVETFLINFSRGTGLEGLTGIPSVNENIVRPILVFSREEIQKYAEENNIQWREDSSNASDKYVRNKIRHHLVPILKEINPSFLSSFQNTLEYLNQEQSLVSDAVELVYQKVVTEDNNQLKINISELLQYKNHQAYLYQWLHQYGFSAWTDITNLLHAQSGKQIFSDKYVILKDRDFLILSKIQSNGNKEFIINSLTEKPNFPLNFELCNESDILIQSKYIIFVDESQLQFPLKIRKWREGDFFHPFGMTGKKKVSKFFKDEKFTLFEKQETWILESNNQIVWIIGHRSDNRFVANKKTHNTIKITFNNEKNN